MLDITLKIEKDNKVWEWIKSGENKLMNLGHVGTHIDVYEKSQVPLEFFKCDTVIIDCRTYKMDEEIGIEVLEQVNIKKGDFIIFKTYIQNQYQYGSEVYIKNHHQLSYELIEYLLSKEVSFIGIDGPGIRRGKEHVGVDIKAERNKTFIIENLDLSRVDLEKQNRFLGYIMWIDNPFSTGLSTRVILE